MNNSSSQNKDKTILSELKTTIIDLGVDDLPTFGGKYEGGIHLQQIADEIAPCIYDLMKLNTKFHNFLEIGSAAGGNTYLFNHFFNFDNITIIDDNRHKKYALRQEILKDVPHREWIGDSHDLKVVSYLEELGLNYDIIFIDGDHSYEGVKKDFETFKEFLNYGGLILFHDSAANTAVKPFVDGIKEEAKMFNEYKPEVHSIKLFGDYVGRDRKLGVTVFQIYTIPKWREQK